MFHTKKAQEGKGEDSGSLPATEAEGGPAGSQVA